MNLNLKNLYIRHAKDIKNLADSKAVDVGVALDMWCNDRGIRYVPHDNEQIEFLNLCREHTLDKVVESL